MAKKLDNSSSEAIEMSNFIFEPDFEPVFEPVIEPVVNLERMNYL